MEKSKPSTSSKQNVEKTCKSCKKIFDESRILKHITHGSCEENYTNEEMDTLRNLSYERRKRRNIEQRHKKRERKLKLDVLALTEVCRSCQKTFSEDSILKHVMQSDCIRDYSNDEIGWLRSWADEGKRDREVDYRTENKESLALKRKEKLDSKKSNERTEIMDYKLQICKACKKTFEDTSLLRHLNKMKSCKDIYTEEEWKYITGWTSVRKKCIDSIFYKDNKDLSNFKEQKRLNNTKYWEKNKDSIATKRKEKLEKEKKSGEGLLKMCKSCKKRMGDKSILKHLSQKESCMSEYNEEEMEFLRGWSDKRKKKNDSSYYQNNKDAIISKKSQRYKQQKEVRKEETRRLQIENQKERFERLKISYEREARSYNNVFYSVTKDNFPKVFAEFRTFMLSEDDSQTVSLLENSIEETNREFEREIDRVAHLSRELQYDRDSIYDLYSKSMADLSQIKNEWHELKLKINRSLREIATKMKKPYSWVGDCTCEECKNAKQMQGKGKGKGKKSKKS